MTRTSSLLLAFGLAVTAAACDKKDEGTPTPPASTKGDGPIAKSPEPPPVAGDMAKPGAYTVDPVHSFLIFKIHHFNAGYVFGEFEDFDGKLTVDADPTKDSVTLNVKTASVHTHNPKRDGHLQSPDFFNAEQFPAITFKSTGVAKGDGANLNVTGDLTIRGKTKSIVIAVTPTGAAEDPQKNYRAGFEGHTTINRMDYDVAFMPGALGEKVDLILALEVTADK